MQIDRIVAPNPGPMTLTGTNTYVLDDGAGNVAVIDPGPDDLPLHVDAILEAAAGRGTLATVIATHRHLDHAPAASLIRERTGVPLSGHRDLPYVERPISDGQRVFADLIALETPGHTRDSVCLWDAATRSLFTGDLVLGAGTAVLDDAPGALSDYLESLRRLAKLEPKTIYPGHGPIVDDGMGKLTEYQRHREMRLQQVVDALAADGIATPAQLAATIYTDTPPNLLPMAARNVRANLDLLLAQGRVERLSNDQWRWMA